VNFYLLGYPLGHSVSPPMHNAAFKELGMPHNYTLLEVQREHLARVMDDRLRVAEFGGASVTIPHKIEVIPYLDKLAESATRAGAVNTIQHRDGMLIGHNTDALGGVRALIEKYGDISGSTVVLLGAGGAANALAAELAPKVGNIIILNRSAERAKELSNRLGENATYGSISDQAVIETANILINATPVGMHPKTDVSPVDPKRLHSDLLVYDIIYNPQKTQLLKDAEKAGARTLGGLWMLVYQGVEAFKIWTRVEPNADTMYDAALKALEDMH
jgi:shikimate dehydrogenase